MMTYKYILLNNELITSDEILDAGNDMLHKDELPNWERDLYAFLKEWFSDSDFILAQTSGSTGDPKTIELPKADMIKSAERTIEYFGLKKDDRLLMSLPCHYIAGKMMVVRAIVGQMNLITVDPATDFEFLEREAFDFGAMVPNQVSKILNQNSGSERIQNIHNLLVGGAAISEGLADRISQLTSRIVSTYGMTETASHIAIQELSGDMKSGFYHCLSGISVSLNKSGCLQIHLPERITTLSTNDLAELRSETSFKILGRADSVIISGGIKYFPDSIEKKLERLITSRFIISSVPDEKLGEKMVLVIESSAFNTSNLESQIAQYLTQYERPKSIIFLPKFPETISKKIIRSEIKSKLNT